MKFLILNTDYPFFMKWLYSCHPELDEQSYEMQTQVRMGTLFGTADFYSTNLRRLGYEAWDVIANLESMQKQWAKENDIDWGGKGRHWRLGFRKRIIPWLYKDHARNWLYPILEAQVKAYRPDVLYSMTMETIGSDFLRTVRGHYRLAVVQHAAPFPPHDFSEYDVALSSLPNLVDYFRKQGIRSELFRLGFEPKVLSALSTSEKGFDIAFVGGLGKHHEQGTKLLERLCERHNVRVWGYGFENLSQDSPIRKVYGGPLWGIGMYQVLRAAKIVFNRHIDIAEDYANNMRLYEATGAGSFLLTDFKQNLCDMFAPGKEVVVYRDANECLELAGYYLAYKDKREAIARAGQQRTLSEHTWYHRMQELVEIVHRYL